MSSEEQVRIKRCSIVTYIESAEIALEATAIRENLGQQSSYSVPTPPLDRAQQVEAEESGEDGGDNLSEHD